MLLVASSRQSTVPHTTAAHITEVKLLGLCFIVPYFLFDRVIILLTRFLAFGIICIVFNSFFYRFFAIK